METPHPEILPGEIEASAESHSLARALETLQASREDWIPVEDGPILGEDDVR